MSRQSYLLLLYVLISLSAITCSRDFPATAPYVPPIVSPVSNPSVSRPPAKPPAPPSQPPGMMPAPPSPTPTPPTQPPASPTPPPQPPAPPKRLFLANDQVRVGIDLDMGGAITYLSEAGSTQNMVNNADLGRQIQTALYGSPNPYSVNGKDPVEYWKYLGWNPVQAGDYHYHPAPIVSYQQTPNLLYVKTIPLIWPLFNQPADCVFEHWISLQANSVQVRARMSINRADTTFYEARTQEMPCVYLNGPYHRRVTYTGLKPFTNDALSEITTGGNQNGTEHWAALLNDQGRGVGLFKAGEVRFGLDKFGLTNTGGEFDGSSGYMNTNPALLIDHNGQYEYEYSLVVGSLADIRQFVYAQPRPPAGPDYQFVKDRQGWYYVNTRDTGWPIRQELNVQWRRSNVVNHGRFRIAGPSTFWQAADVPQLVIQAAFQTKGTVARLVWRKAGEIDFFEIPDRYVDFPIIGDGVLRSYVIQTGQLGGWEGAIAQISLTSPDSEYAHEPGSTVRIRSITTK